MSRTGKSEAIVLRNQELRETDLIAVFFTRGEGKLHGVARGARGGRVRRFGGALLPGTVVNLDWLDNRRSELVRVDECSIVRSYFNELSRNPSLSYIQAYFLELTDGFTVQRDPQDDLYRLLRLVMENAVKAGEKILAVRRYFEFWLLKLSGLFPELHCCCQCGEGIKPAASCWMHPEEGIRCSRCSAKGDLRWRIDAAAVCRLEEFARQTLPGVLQSTDGKVTRIDSALEDVMTGCLRRHLNREIRSLAALSEYR